MADTTPDPTPPEPQPWLHRNLRPLVLLLMTCAVVYLAVIGIAEARTALISTFSLLIAALWGERAALKVPGKDA